MTDAHPTAHDSKAANAMWGGRFQHSATKDLQHLNASIRFDQRLAREDIAGSLAHAAMLAAQGIISQEDRKAIEHGFRLIEEELNSGQLHFQESLEDIHMNLEHRLFSHIGEPARRLHTARSRNDQVATDFRLWIRKHCDGLDERLQELQQALLEQAEQHAATPIPGYTHLQPAQPVTFGHHLLAYVEMLGRDRGRFADCRQRLNECPLGSAALAGTSFPINRDATALALGFEPLRQLPRWRRLPGFCP
jgi:argininosuccinate lyase